MLYSPKTYKNFKFRTELQDQRQRQLGRVLPLPHPNGELRRGLRGPGRQHPPRPDPHRLALHVHPYLRHLVPPDTWFTYEIEVVTKDFRGHR